MVDLLLSNCPSTFTAYKGTRVNAVMQVYPLLNMMCLAAMARRKGFTVKVVDLGIDYNPYETFRRVLQEEWPRFVGITSTTPLFFEAAELSKITRNILGDEVTIIYGGPHATALPEESLELSNFDIAVCGEGEVTLTEILEGKKLAEINGIYYKQDGRINHTDTRELIKDLDSLPFPALDLYDIKRYRCPELISKRWPLSQIETSRGCPSACMFCNKNISARLFRKKSPERVLEEIKYMLSLGVREIRVIDDQFATDINRAKRICELIIKENLDFSWNMANGVRVDRVDEEFLILAKRAGCYQSGIGFESGDQASLDAIDKDITIEQSIKCMELMKKVGGIETVGFFMLGLPTDTEESLKKTVNFAVRLMPDLAKATVTIPFPGTRLFEYYEQKGLIKSRNWSIYNLHKAEEIYDHPILSHDTLKHYYNLFYRKFYFNPKYLMYRLNKSRREKTILRDMRYGGQTFFPGLFPVDVKPKPQDQRRELGAN
ncbi:MAG: radical SAM protein [Candidatus Schekmanbacteria bacterium]|nr:radical SAM protein [Candidatus Schekmanbacteria bacterium]